MLDTIEKAFAQELLKVSHNAGRIMDFAWTLYKIGGAVPLKVVAEQFPDAEDFVSKLSKAGMARYAMGGIITKGQAEQSISVSLREEVLSLFSPGVRRKEFEDTIYRNFGDRLIQSCKSDITEPLTVMLASVIFFATPQKPVFSNTIIRKAAKQCMRDHSECKDLLDYYLNRFLGLISFDMGSMINLSVRSKQRVRMYPRIWQMYVTDQKNKNPQETEKREAELPRRPERKPESKMSEQEKKLKAYFPWLKL